MQLGAAVFTAMALMVLAGCTSLAGLPQPVPETVACADRDGTRTLYYATNRSAPDAADVADRYGFSRSETLHYGKARVAFGGASGGSAISAVSVTAFRDEAAFLSALREEGRARPLAGRRGLVFVHGYDESFERAVRRSATFLQQGCIDSIPILFAWPSRGRALSYGYDRDSALYSRDALAHLLVVTSERAGFRQLDLFAHSMGNFVVLEALRTLYLPARRTAGPILDHVVLASPDVDADLFRTNLVYARRAARRLFLLTSQQDLLLKVSQVVAGGAPRAGTADDAVLFASEAGPLTPLERIDADAPENGGCAAFDHRCTETNPVILQKLRVIFGPP